MSGPNAAPAVALKDVRKTYHLGEPVHALDGVTLSVPRGSFTAVMGPSGSGKSTLLNLVGCLDTPTSGSVVVNGRDVGALSGRERTALRGEAVGFVFQTFNLMPRLSARDNVALPMVFRGVGRRERRERAQDLLARVGLADRVDHRPSELSGGQRQRVAVARALANDPAILLADEPTGNLDTETGDRILGLFEELDDAGNTILMVTHERRDAEHAERIVHLLDGTVERVETVERRRRAGGDAAAGGGAVADGPEGPGSDGRGPDGEAVGDGDRREPDGGAVGDGGGSTGDGGSGSTGHDGGGSAGDGGDSGDTGRSGDDPGSTDGTGPGGGA